MESRSRDDRILDHIGLYSISLRPVLERLFFEGKNCGNVIQRLTKQGKIVSRPGLPSRVRYYQLTTSEATARAFPQHRTEPLGTQAINKHLAILWHCCLADGNRHRIERGDVKSNISEHLPPGDYAVEQFEGNHRIVRIRIASSDAEDSSIVRWVRGEVGKAAKHPHLSRLQRSGQVAYALLADTETRIPSLQRSLEDSGLLEQSTVVVAFAPSPHDSTCCPEKSMTQHPDVPRVMSQGTAHTEGSLEQTIWDADASDFLPATSKAVETLRN